MEELCQDCLENPIDRKQLKLCNKCFNRRNNCKARGKEYIPKRLQNYTEKVEKVKETKVKIKKEVKEETKKEVKETPKDIEGFEFIDVDLDKIENAIEFLSNALENLHKMMQIVEEMTQELLVISHKKEKTKGPKDPEYMTLAEKEWNILNYRRTLKNAIAFLQKLNPGILNSNLVEYTKRFKTNIEASEYRPKSAHSKTYVVSVSISGLKGTSGIQMFQRTVYSNDEHGAKSYVENFLKSLNGVTIFNNSWKIKEVTSDVTYKKD